ncbi:N-acetyl-gamma-glutamyl-phosphate reductase [Phytopseudomonas daroniae]|uniref:N-acetyl-gamma-glutamyl-phosphate reductase n=1 Tax=Phytopseudomonas daroniae TaxID=2487519 RepID=UPI0010383411|nr:N-acetyl-gamma-glutamyl-phosphate reductase [Pseudomonas daroniae]TBU72580.1 N-acetyl-gamma-glutamyl-phosphate reductase [Pseudomonas daroniae]
MKYPTVFIDGDQGTTGLQIHQRLRNRSDLKLITLAPEHRKDSRRRAEAINTCDFAILCLPDPASRDAVAAIENPDVRVIDASSAHRTHPDWIYGFAEMDSGQPRRIAMANRVSNPGCYPTGAIGLLRPLLRAGLVRRDYPAVIHAVSGYSGKGRTGIDEYEGEQSILAPAFQVYGLGLAHKHVPEIQQQSGLTERPVFVPAYGAFRQGIVLTVALHSRFLAEGVNARQLHECLEMHYRATKHVQVMPRHEANELTHLDPQSLNGSDGMRLAILDNEGSGQVLLAAVFDNLGKGAAGAAVQNLDLMMSGV